MNPDAPAAPRTDRLRPAPGGPGRATTPGTGRPRGRAARLRGRTAAPGPGRPCGRTARPAGTAVRTAPARPVPARPARSIRTAEENHP
ncbi:hypothetical protein ACFXA3_33260 [Streptomyces sp. NPDC059456]|uniref:hypothetical protein n=1 Tax=Streptomyces sp. NPDC059456 TaxID=3346838 RepID=UPI0036769D75